jgi:hypothetical protein
VKTGHRKLEKAGGDPCGQPIKRELTGKMSGLLKYFKTHKKNEGRVLKFF